MNRSLIAAAVLLAAPHAFAAPVAVGSARNAKLYVQALGAVATDWRKAPGGSTWEKYNDMYNKAMPNYHLAPFLQQSLTPLMEKKPMTHAIPDTFGYVAQSMRPEELAELQRLMKSSRKYDFEKEKLTGLVVRASLHAEEQARDEIDRLMWEYEYVQKYGPANESQLTLLRTRLAAVAPLLDPLGRDEAQAALKKIDKLLKKQYDVKATSLDAQMKKVADWLKKS